VGQLSDYKMTEKMVKETGDKQRRDRVWKWQKANAAAKDSRGACRSKPMKGSTTKKLRVKTEERKGMRTN
jgi:hypothetical protein